MRARSGGAAMTATSIFSRAACASLTFAASLGLAALGPGIGPATAAPWQPVPTDIPYSPIAPDPGADPGLGGYGGYGGYGQPDYSGYGGYATPAASGLPGGLGMPGSGLPGPSGIGGITPLIADTTKLLSAGSDPNALVSNAQSLLNDAGSLLGVPVGMPSLSSFVPTTGVPNVGAPAPAFAPATPMAPIGPAL
jgi:hypothetical protein